MPALRYVVLHHTGIDSPHYDLMFEQQPHAPLTTFRCAIWPPAPDTIFELLPDHRPAYLQYEGPISNNRGQVTRIEAGTCTVESKETDSLQLSLSSGLKLSVPAGRITE